MTEIPNNIPTVFVEVALVVIAIPWVTWVTVSVFSLKQENAILREGINDIKEMLLKKRR